MEFLPVKRILASLAGLALLAVTAAAAGANGQRKAPELAFTIPSQGQKLLSQYRGKVVALEFIFTTCPHCQAASKLMTKLQNEYGGKGLQVIDVAINDNADLKVDDFVKDYQVGFPVGWTPRDQMLTFMGFSMAERFVVPQLVLIDRKGVIHYQTPPMGEEHSMQESTIRERVEELLNLGNSSASAKPSKALVAKKGS
jgi:peroxiredoxin